MLAALLGACACLVGQLAPFLPDAARRIAAQCTGIDGVLPGPEPVFARLGAASRPPRGTPRLTSVSDAPAVEISGLVKNYGRTTAVAGLSMRAERGQITAVLGPNGAGKTTTVEICEGYRRPDAGTVRVLGLDPVRDARALRPRVGVMLQSGGIPTSARAADYLKVIARFYAQPARPGPADRPARPGGSARTPFRRLSGGQQQRLSLAAAVIGRPELLFLDEPTAGLDPQARHATWELITGLRDVGCRP